MACTWGGGRLKAGHSKETGSYIDYTENTRHSPNAVSTLDHRLRRWPNIDTALGECFVFAENIPRSEYLIGGWFH